MTRVMITTDSVGGVWTYALELARGLGEHGVEVVLAGLGPRADDTRRAEASSLPHVRFLDTGLPLDWTAECPDELEEASARLRKLAFDIAPDVIHLNSPALAGRHSWPAPVLGATHSCLATWWAAVRGDEPPTDFQWRIAAHRSGLAACDATVAPSAAFAGATIASHGGPPPAVVWNGRRGAPSVGGPRQRRVIVAGRLWDAGKDVATLDVAAAFLDAPVFAAGPLDGPGGERIQLSHVRPLGQLSPEQLRSEMAASSIFCSTAVYEPFGLSVLEAAQAGCALVLSDIQTFRELWDGAAIFVPPRDPWALCSALARLEEDPVAAMLLGRAAERHARRFTVEAMTAGVLDLYRRIAPQAFPAVAREAVA